MNNYWIFIRTNDSINTIKYLLKFIVFPLKIVKFLLEPMILLKDSVVFLLEPMVPLKADEFLLEVVI